MEETTLISPKYLKTWNPQLTENIEEKYLRAAILKAQKLHVDKNMCGTQLYQKLCSDVKNDTLTGIYKTLLDTKIAPALAEWAMSIFITENWAKITPKGINTTNSENSTPLTKEDIIWVVSGIENNAESFTHDAISYLIDNAESIPEYRQSTNYSDNKPNNNPYFCGIQMRKKRR